MRTMTMGFCSSQEATPGLMKIVKALKTVSIEMDLAERLINQKAFIKWRGAEAFGKSARPLFCERH
jgi:hypothetical protein